MDEMTYWFSTLFSVVLVLVGVGMVIHSYPNRDGYWLIFGLTLVAAGVYEFRRTDARRHAAEDDDEFIGR